MLLLLTWLLKDRSLIYYFLSMDWFNYLADKQITDEILINYLVAMRDDFQRNLDDFNRRITNKTDQDKLFCEDSLNIIKALQACITDLVNKNQMSKENKEFLKNILERELKNLRGEFTDDKLVGLIGYLQDLSYLSQKYE